MHDLPDWAQYDDVVQRSVAVLRLPFEDPAKPAALIAIGRRAYEVRDLITAERAFSTARVELDRLREPGLLDRVRGRTPTIPEALRPVEREADALHAQVLLLLGRADDAAAVLEHAADLPVAPGDTAAPLLLQASGWAALERDRPQTAEELIGFLLARPDLADGVREVETARAAVARMVQGDATGSVSAVESAVAALGSTSAWADVASWGDALVDAHLAERSLRGARDAVARLEESTVVVASADRLRVSQATAQVAVVLAAIGEDDDAQRWMRRAVDGSRFSAGDVLAPALFRGVQLLVTARWQRHLTTRRLARVLRGTAWWTDALSVEQHQAILQTLCESMLDLVSRSGGSSSALQQAAKLALLEAREDDAVSLMTAAAGAAVAEGDSPLGGIHALAVLDLVGERDDDALRRLEEALALAPEDSFEQAGLLHELAALHARAGRSEQSVLLYDRAATSHLALEHRPDHEDCVLNLSVLRGEPVPASFTPFRSGLFEMLWG